MSEYENLLRQIKSQVPVDESFDLLERKLKIGERDATMFFVDGLVDGDVMQRVVASLQGLDKKQWIERKLPENLWLITWHSLIVCWLPT